MTLRLSPKKMRESTRGTQGGRTCNQNKAFAKAGMSLAIRGAGSQWLEPDEAEEAEPGGEGPCRSGRV